METLVEQHQTNHMHGGVIMSGIRIAAATIMLLGGLTLATWATPEPAPADGMCLNGWCWSNGKCRPC